MPRDGEVQTPEITAEQAMAIAIKVRDLVLAEREAIVADNVCAERGAPSEYEASEVAEGYFETLNEFAQLLGVNVEPEPEPTLTADALTEVLAQAFEEEAREPATPGHRELLESIAGYCVSDETQIGATAHELDFLISVMQRARREIN